MAPQIEIAIYSALGAAGVILLSATAGLLVWWFFKRAPKPEASGDEPEKEKARLTGDVNTKIRMYNQDEVESQLRREESARKATDKTQIRKRVSGKSAIMAGGGDSARDKPPEAATGKVPANQNQTSDPLQRSSLHSDLRYESDDPTAKTSTPVLDEDVPALVIKKEGRKPMKGAGGMRVSETGDTPLSCIEPLTGPFSEDKPYVVAYADLMTVGRGAPLPITEEASNILSSLQHHHQHNTDTSIDSSDFHIVKKKPPKKAGPISSALRSPSQLSSHGHANLHHVTGGGGLGVTGSSILTTESSDDQDNFHSPSRHDRRLHRMMTGHSQKGSKGTLNNKLSSLTLTHPSNSATIDDSNSNSMEIDGAPGRHSKLSMGEEESVYYSEYSVTISPENDAEQREVVSEPGIISSTGGGPRTGTPALPNVVITHDDTTVSHDEQAADERDKPEGSNVALPSIDAESSSTLLSKASRRSIVSVAFATCNESGNLHEQNDGMTSATPDDEVTRSASVEQEANKSEELSLVNDPNPPHMTITLPSEPSGDVGVAAANSGRVGGMVVDFREPATPPASIVIGDSTQRSDDPNATSSIQINTDVSSNEMNQNNQPSISPNKRGPHSKTPYAYINMQNTSSAESEIAVEKDDQLRHHFTTTDTESDVNDRILLASDRSGRITNTGNDAIAINVMSSDDHQPASSSNKDSDSQFEHNEP
ncbi:uncharacterized protein LOC142335110 isoform X2 [Convolutriloba macropyga]|uniref:uncharacterized protein LOC142335110 isoform X2 n=1 Tax=Convolutriloba macropyga TaxID=536237 RepID=UPI003F525DF1